MKYVILTNSLGYYEKMTALLTSIGSPVRGWKLLLIYEQVIDEQL